MIYRREYRPGNETFVSVDQSAPIPDTTFEPRSTQVPIRLTRTFRY